MNNDILKLNVSQTFTLANNNEADINLNLSLPQIDTNGSVRGTIYDTTLLTGSVVAGATVKVFLADGTPYAHTVSSTDGTYAISDLPMGIYTIAAVKDGNYLSASVPLTISSPTSVEINLALINNEVAKQNIIYGILTDSVTNLPLNDVKVSLYSVVGDIKTLVSSTVSIADGEYILDKIIDGNYELIFEKTGYQTSEINNVALTGGTMFNATTTLTSTTGDINNTVSGIIKTDLGVIVPNAFVGLYQILNGVETLVSTTYTNAEGKYMFGNVLDGEYLVKAKLSNTL